MVSQNSLIHSRAVFAFGRFSCHYTPQQTWEASMGAPVLVFALAVGPFSIRFVYLIKFRYDTAVARPLKYIEAKAILTGASVLFIVVGALILLIAGHWALALTLVIGCILLDRAARLYSYRRAVDEHISWLTSVPVESRRTMATQMVDMEIKNGDRM
ncbi:MAG: hypothetical protein ACHP8B_01740 [Terriglobales bacterium]